MAIDDTIPKVAKKMYNFIFGNFSAVKETCEFSSISSDLVRALRYISSLCIQLAYS
jgi:hypothetical protein